MSKPCYHCGKECKETTIVIADKNFCCQGCKTVYEILDKHQLTNFYNLNAQSGIEPDSHNLQQFDYLDTPEIQEVLFDFKDDTYAMLHFFIPVIHCASCIWLLESLPKINPNIIVSQVDFTHKKLKLSYIHQNVKLSELVRLLTQLGYKPIISHQNAIEKNQKTFIDRRLLTQLAVAFFCAGNIMLIAFPEYIGSDSKWLEGSFKHFFRALMLLLSLPVVFYAAQDYFKSAFKSIEYNVFNMDLPISLGILTLFFRSIYDIFFNDNNGYFDSLGTFVFFLLLSRLFQQRTYSYLAFDRDYKSFYPISVTKIIAEKEKNILLNEIQKGDRLLIRNQEIIPADAILISAEAQIDNSFVTGESKLIRYKSGDKIYAGGKQVGQAIEVELIKALNQSYLTQLWNNDVFKKKEPFREITNRISKVFSIRILIISILAGIFWYFYEKSRVFEIISAVLIVACPCAISMAAPFTLGNIMRIFSQKGFYVKDTAVIENLAQINHIVFDKTGTITENNEAQLRYEGENIQNELAVIQHIVKQSNHPLSRILYQKLPKLETIPIINYQEIAGKGLVASYNDKEYKIGSASFVGLFDEEEKMTQTKVYISINQQCKGKFIIENKYREALPSLVKELAQKGYHLSIISGDNNAEQDSLENLMPIGTPLLFNQQPQDKLNYIAQLQDNHKVLMIGDGLNDAGALKQSHVGISIADDINSFSPSCDAILQGKSFNQLNSILKISKQAVILVKISFGISILYNLIGLIFAVTGSFNPLVAAIIMPLSTFSVIVFSTLSAYWVTNNINHE